MRPGRGSRTAVVVCKARAFAQRTRTVAGFHDPTAIALLPDDDRAEVEKEITRPGSRSFAHVNLVKRGAMMIARTVAIDEVVRETAAPQVVILGAGLDGRAWRMSELKDAIVFEVDHPDSQREKRARIGNLTAAAREIRFTAVDFAKDDLDTALASAGHDATRPTTWIWEGVVMYLALADIEKTLAVVQRRSAAGSSIAILYHCPGRILGLVSLVVRWMGEPLKSIFTAPEMRTLLARYGFAVARDEDIPTIAARLSADLAQDTPMMGHLRVVSARTA